MTKMKSYQEAYVEEEEQAFCNAFITAHGLCLVALQCNYYILNYYITLPTLTKYLAHTS